MIETRTIRLGALDFTVNCSGADLAPTVLLLHGFPETRHMWRHQLETLAAAGYRVVAPDQRGYAAGARPPREQDYATDLIVADALAMMDALGAQRFHLVGHDWGGQIAWLLAAAYPMRVQSLAVLSRPHPTAFARAMREDPAQAERSRHHRAFREPDTIPRLRDAELHPLREVMEQQGVPRADAEIYRRALSAEGALEATINWYRASTLATEIAAITVPTLYVWGTEDATVGRMAAELTAHYVRASYRFIALAGAGHFVVDQFPAQISNLLLAHLHAHS